MTKVVLWSYLSIKDFLLQKITLITEELSRIRNKKVKLNFFFILAQVEYQ